MLTNSNFYKLLLKTILLITLSSSALAITINDGGQINPTDVSQIVRVQSETDILQALQKANREHLPIAIMGKRESQGGQTIGANAIELDMLRFNKVLNIDTKNKLITTQSGITWGDLQKYINSYNLAIKSMQSANVFTVGGSVSVNAHGDDFRDGAVGDTIISFHMLLADGQKILVTPTTHPDLWKAARGGYGLLGIITDVTLQLTDNDLLVSHYHEVDVEQFPNYFQNKILANKDMVLFYAHLNTVPGPEFLRNIYAVTYADKHEVPNKVIPLQNPDKQHATLTPALKGMYDNQEITRNNAMEKPLKVTSKFPSKNSVDWVQEYFIPVAKLPTFIGTLRDIATKNNINLLNVTIHYVPREDDVLLSYAKTDSFSVMIHFNQSLVSDAINQTQSWTRELIEAALSMGGSYFLTYQNFATNEEFKKAYPGYKQLLETKHQYDPNNIFTNKLYETYMK